FRAQVLDNYNNQFYHPNVKDSVYKHFQKLIPIDELAMDELVCRYLINDSFVFSKLKYNTVLPFAPKTPPEHVVREIREQWQDYCPVQASEA
ncbi:MAG: hypothetical protein KTR18_13875, partial [Acidiferrobacterales bacterium]|nr:hypothetical protein [Acidiferrobacterales bacterium]